MIESYDFSVPLCLLFFNYQRPVGSRIPLVEPLEEVYLVLKKGEITLKPIYGNMTPGKPMYRPSHQEIYFSPVPPIPLASANEL